METHRLCWGFTLAHARPITSRHIWLALDDNEHETSHPHSPDWEMDDWMELEDCDHFHRQLFYWLLLRFGPTILPTDHPLSRGVPHQLLYHN